jgi:hypothetical protein
VYDTDSFERARPAADKPSGLFTSRAHRIERRELTELDRRLLNDFQQDFPLSPTPYADIARDLGVTEAEVLARLEA